MRLQRAVTSKRLDRFFLDLHPFFSCVILFITHVNVFVSINVPLFRDIFVPNYASRPGKYPLLNIFESFEFLFSHTFMGPK